jgi:hypothetical protein
VSIGVGMGRCFGPRDTGPRTRDLLGRGLFERTRGVLAPSSNRGAFGRHARRDLVFGLENLLQ